MSILLSSVSIHVVINMFVAVVVAVVVVVVVVDVSPRYPFAVAAFWLTPVSLCRMTHASCHLH